MAASGCVSASPQLSTAFRPRSVATRVPFLNSGRRRAQTAVLAIVQNRAIISARGGARYKYHVGPATHTQKTNFGVYCSSLREKLACTSDGRASYQKTHSYDDRAILAHLYARDTVSDTTHTLSHAFCRRRAHATSTYLHIGRGLGSPRTERGHHCSELRVTSKVIVRSVLGPREYRARDASIAAEFGHVTPG